jgi:FkbH-like protein
MSLQLAAVRDLERLGEAVDVTQVVQIIQQNRKAIAETLFQSADVVLAPTDEAPREKIVAELIFLENYLLGRREFGDFLVGDKARCLRELDPTGSAQDHERRLRQERDAILRATEELFTTEQSLTLDSHLKKLHSPLTLVSSGRLNILFIGDCLGRELQCFLYPTCRSMGIDLNLTHLGGKTEFLVKKAVEEWPHEDYDLIFYSPFTHESVPEYSGIARKPFLLDGTVQEVAATAVKQAISIIEWLRNRFPAPAMFVHDSSFLVREADENSDASALKKAKQKFGGLLSRRVRYRARDTVNALMRQYLSAQAPSRRLHLLEESELTQTIGDENLRKFLAYGPDVHPTVLGFKLADLYGRIISAYLLRNKKVLVTDLDDTLWKGLIGEGSVIHLPERQLVLKDLRQKGLLLAVASKNDAANVKWDESLLRADDFVATRINWSPKAENIRSIAKELNLGTKEFIFLDDMPSERALVQGELPDVTVMDSTAETTWLTLRHLCGMSAGNTEMDRTQLYRERQRRNEFVQSHSTDRERHQAALKSLRLRVRLVNVSKKNAARVVELVNRTNQFNITGLRVTDKEILSRIGDPQRPVLCADVSDRFGENGLVSCALLQIRGDEVEIEALVLSCRVFGFGVETALVNAVKRYASTLRCRRVIARFVNTERNQPCRTFLPDHDFNQEGEFWCCELLSSCVDPDWLSVELHA